MQYIILAISLTSILAYTLACAAKFRHIKHMSIHKLIRIITIVSMLVLYQISVVFIILFHEHLNCVWYQFILLFSVEITHAGYFIWTFFHYYFNRLINEKSSKKQGKFYHYRRIVSVYGMLLMAMLFIAISISFIFSSFSFSFDLPLTRESCIYSNAFLVSMIIFITKSVFVFVVVLYLRSNSTVHFTRTQVPIFIVFCLLDFIVYVLSIFLSDNESENIYLTFKAPICLFVVRFIFSSILVIIVTLFPRKNAVYPMKVMDFENFLQIKSNCEAFHRFLIQELSVEHILFLEALVELHVKLFNVAYSQRVTHVSIEEQNHLGVFMPSVRIALQPNFIALANAHAASSINLRRTPSSHHLLLSTSSFGSGRKKRRASYANSTDNSASHCRLLVKNVMNTYFDMDSLLEVNVSCDCVKLIEEKLATIEKDNPVDRDFALRILKDRVFERSFCDIFALLRDGGYSRFVTTQEYVEIAKQPQNWITT